MERNDCLAPQFAVCVDNSGYPASLELLKLYQIVSDDTAASDGDLRVIDESGEDYLFSARRFVPLVLPEAVIEEIHAAQRKPRDRRLL